jgi:hypothetical protein
VSSVYHAKYFANELTRRSATDGVAKLSISLFDAAVDLNPHQIEAALFAFRSPLSKGVLLADEVGLGKTIEAGLILCQYWAERRRKLLVICPASLRKQWSLELQDKFNLPSVILDARSYRVAVEDGSLSPFNDTSAVIITSMNFASRMAGSVQLVPWDTVVIDEAHKLRNAYRTSNKMGQAIRTALADRKKVLLTATPLQNSLLELYGLSTIIDDNIFGDLAAFRTQYCSSDGDIDGLKTRLRSFCHRTLRGQVLEYVKYTQRRPITRPFAPADSEQELYDAISGFLRRDDTYSIPHRQRELTTMILRKLLASSSQAVAGTLETIRQRLVDLKAKVLEGKAAEQPESIAEQLILEDDLDEELLDAEAEAEGETPADESPLVGEQPKVDLKKLDAEIAELERFVQWARSIGVDAKTRALLTGLQVGFDEMQKTGGKRKVVIFTESRRTQEYLRNFLEANGYAGKIVLFSGTNSGPDVDRIYQEWERVNEPLGRTSSSKTADKRNALIEYFRDTAEILIATESAAEGVNLQFCSLVINYDLPWNPQRIEQRIGRCHRYGQKHDVVVINFLNERNEADKRVFQLLTEKFNLFSGVFGASDDVLGTIESGVDFEKRVFAIYQTCRTPEQIQTAFAALQSEMEESIRSRMTDTRKKLLEHFDEDVHERFKTQLDETRQRLDVVSRMFWRLTKFILADLATFDDPSLTFDLKHSPRPDAKPGKYHLISKTQQNIEGEFLYRISHPLGEHAMDAAKTCHTPSAVVTFKITGHPVRIRVVEELKGKSGTLILSRLTIDSFDREEYLLFNALTDDGKSLDQETCEKLFHCEVVTEPDELSTDQLGQLEKETERHARATVSRSLETNNKHFNEERERLERWADDQVIAAERELADTKARIKALNRQARLATTTDEQLSVQNQIKTTEQEQRKQRQQIFDLEDEAKDKRDRLISVLEQRMTQKTSRETLFTIRWNVK